MHDPTERAARISDAQHLLHLTARFPRLPFPSIAPYLASFQFTHLTDAAVAAEAVRAAEGILSRQLKTTFAGRYPEPTGSAAYYQRTAELTSGLFVYITARAEVGPLLDTEDARDRVPVAA